ncbi:MAG: DMT family transporter, partial [Betaproteobacteria bacterium]|nr:DMT family transporter [Betaproteobacteria bacterium]
PLMAAVCYSLYQIMTRRFSATEHPVTTLFYTGFVGSIVISLVVPIFWVAPQIRDLPAFLFLGFAGAFGHFMLIKAMELEDASFLSPLTYVQLIWVTLLGYFAFDHLPTNVGFVGMAIIVGAGLYVALGARESSTRHRSS